MDRTPHESFISDATDDDFAERVIERSRTVPVVVDFWAAWCGPCRTLGPVIEREVQALGGRVELVKVDTDRSPRVSGEHQIRSIPAVKAFRDGKVVDEFVGAQPAQVVRAFLEGLAPSPERQLLDQARQAMAAGDPARAEGLGREAMERASPGPLLDEAALLVAEALLRTGRAAEIEPVLARIDPRGLCVEAADQLRETARIAAEAPAGGVDAARALVAEKDDAAARYGLGAALLAAGDAGGALAEFLEVVTRSRKFRDDAGRRAMLAVFAMLGPDDELVRDYRRRLQVVT